MQNYQTQIQSSSKKFLDELIDFLSFPSISADSQYKEAVTQTAHWLEEKLQALAMDEVKVFPTSGHPIVYASKTVDPEAPTVLIYGHYDVQPPDPLDLWDSDPFTPVIKDEKIYARGACDDKGQVYMHLKALEILNQNGPLPCNVKFLIEGEEEVGSEGLPDFVKNHKELLKADLMLISDTSMLANDTPSITVGLRGMAYMEVHITGPNRDLHSGVYGGAVDNPINVLCEMIAHLKDKDGRITIPGFYDQVYNLSQSERDDLGRAPFHEASFLNDLGIGAAKGEKGYSIPELKSIRPTLDVNGIWGGYTGEGSKTVLPSQAHAKISMRLVPNQNSEKIAELFTEYLQRIAPPTVQIEIINHHGGEAAVTSTDSIGYQAASKAFEKAFGKPPIPTREGGSIPIVALFQQELGLDTILMGFGLNSDNIHSPNEHYGLFNYFKGIETIAHFHEILAEMKRS
ncbi:MAG: dipeptidase [Bacteroidota bacterium]